MKHFVKFIYPVVAIMVLAAVGMTVLYWFENPESVYGGL